MRAVLHLDPDNIEITEPGPEAFPFLLEVDSVQIGVRAGHLAGGFSGGGGNCRLVFDNTDDKFIRIDDYPLRVFVEVFDDNDELYFEGMVQDVVFGASVVVTLEA